MAAPFLPDPDAVEPASVRGLDPHRQLMSLGFYQVGGYIAPADVMARIAEGVPEDSPPRWQISDADEAEWAMAKYAEAQSELAALRRQREGYEQRIGQWFDRSAGEALRTAAFFEAHLMLWALEERSTSAGGVKTAKLPSGEIRTRKPGPWKPSIDDAAALLAWALDLRDGGRNIVRSRLLLDVLQSALEQVAVVVEPDGHDDPAPVVLDRETGERIPGTIAKRTESAPRVIAYESD